ncbi:DUF3592 domain-containing protein [Arthrobacter sp.]|uniref:DUF3592 domain-containing protein n=1 Tax=Arthrobacter sp. TaxID=1667 RepID=UPI002810C875|nr:DUF3592 domain-containing protein [Arthrobacter sp.]
MEPVKLVVLVLPGLFLAIGLVLVGLSLSASIRRRKSLRGWVVVPATVTGNLHGKGGPGSAGERFAPLYEFDDAHGRRWLGRSDLFGTDEEIVGTTISVLYNPADPAESTRPVFLLAKTRFMSGVILAIFGAGALAMFATVLGP